MRRDEFERLYAEHAAGLYRFLIYRTRDETLSEDLLADTFERALRARTRFDRGRGSEKSWLYGIALNLVRDHARRRSVEQRITESAVAGSLPGYGLDPALEGVERRELLRQALAELTPEEHEVVALRFGAELTVPEIARLTRRRLKTVEGRLYRALGKLRGRLG